MFDRMLGRYLVDRQLITWEQLKEVYQEQEKTRAKLGVIAVGENLMSVAQAEEINAAQAEMDKRFGDLAIEKGYLNREQLERLIAMQGTAFHTFLQVLSDRNILSVKEVQRVMKEFQKEHNLLPRDMDALIADDIGRITQMHLPGTDEELQRLFTLSVKNMFRLVDRHVMIGSANKVKKISGDVLAYQNLRGDLDATVMIFGEYEDLRKLAVTYTQEEFIETREDVLDAMGELINTNNGLYARERSAKDEGMVDMEPPTFYTNGASVSAGEIVVLPVQICDGTAEYAVAIGNKVQIKPN